MLILVFFMLAVSFFVVVFTHLINGLVYGIVLWAGSLLLHYLFGLPTLELIKAFVLGVFFPAMISLLRNLFKKV